MAVIAVIGYHLGVPYFEGGLLGVGVFFTLSGFLITGILLASWDKTGTFELKKFWKHRARRLLPALMIVLAAVLLFTWWVHPEDLGVRLRESLAGLFYIANWTTIIAGRSYFDQFAGPGPLDHLWSLAVEEQFYVVWPLVLLLAFTVIKVRRIGLAVLTAVLAGASFFLLSVFAVVGIDNTRAYEGTDTRAGGILVGALLAIGWRRLGPFLERHILVRFLAQLAGVGGLVGIGWLAVTTTERSLSLYHSGLLLLSLFTVLALIPAACKRTVFGALVGSAPLRWVGERSYGIYLWHLPIVAAVPIEVLDENRLGWSVLMVAGTLVVSELSWRLVEDPIRRHGLRASLRRVRIVPLLPAGVVSVVLLGAVSLVGTSSASPLMAGVSQAFSGVATTAPSEAAHTPTAKPVVNKPTATPASTATQTPTPTLTPTPVVVNGVQQTSCAAVVHVGESTSLGMVDSTLADPAARLPSQLEKVGVTDPRMDILGARSIVERWNDQPNALDAVQKQINEGYDGCWSIAMGTNDAANQAVGGEVKSRARIDMIMQGVKGQPVLWLTVKTTNKRGPWADKNMVAWNAELLAACERYPNLRIYDWRAEVKDQWYLDDGIHFTKVGNAERAKRIAAALAQAYPKGTDPAASCVVRSGLK